MSEGPTSPVDRAESPPALNGLVAMPSLGHSIGNAIATSRKYPSEVLIAPSGPPIKNKDRIECPNGPRMSDVSINDGDADPLSALGDVERLFNKEPAPFDIHDLVHPPDEPELTGRDDCGSSEYNNISEVNAAIQKDYEDGELLLHSALQIGPHAGKSQSKSGSQTGSIPWHNDTRQKSMQSMHSGTSRGLEGHSTLSRKVMPVQEEEDTPRVEIVPDDRGSHSPPPEPVMRSGHSPPPNHGETIHHIV